MSDTVTIIVILSFKGGIILLLSLIKIIIINKNNKRNSKRYDKTRAEINVKLSNYVPIDSDAYVKAQEVIAPEKVLETSQEDILGTHFCDKCNSIK